MQVVIDKGIQDYLNFANDCASAVLKSPPVTFDLLKDVDLLIREIWGSPVQADAFSMFLCMNGYYLFMAAVRMATAGHVAAIHPLVRSALESACYAFLLTKDASLVTIWANRDKGDKERKASRKAFGNALADTVKHLRGVQIDAAQYVQGLYDASITYGAHPNPSGLFLHVDRPADEGHQWRVPFTCMYGPTSYEVTRGLFACAEFGIGIAYLTVQCVSDHPDHDKLQARFDAVLESKNHIEERLRAESLDDSR